MRDIRSFTDIHSHHQGAGDDTVVSLDYDRAIPTDGYYSIGLHPWQTDMPADNLAAAVDEVSRKAADGRVVAIGECGIDRLRGGDIETQTDIFRRHVAISEAYEKPLIIHAVRSFDLLLALKKELRPRQLWIIHGFRGKGAVARQLLDAGFALSYGEKFNPEAIAITPADRLFTETDESPLPITTIRQLILTDRKA